MIVSRIVFATYGPGACVNWESKIETICPRYATIQGAHL